MEDLILACKIKCHSFCLSYFGCHNLVSFIPSPIKKKKNKQNVNKWKILMCACNTLINGIHFRRRAGRKNFSVLASKKLSMKKAAFSKR